MYKVKTKRTKRKFKVSKAFYTDNEMRMVCEKTMDVLSVNAGTSYIVSFDSSSYIVTSDVLLTTVNWSETATKFNYFKINSIVLELYPRKAPETLENQWGIGLGCPPLNVLWCQNKTGVFVPDIEYNDRVHRVQPFFTKPIRIKMQFEENYDGNSPDPYNKWCEVSQVNNVHGQIQLGMFLPSEFLVGMISHLAVVKYYCSFKDKKI